MEEVMSIWVLDCRIRVHVMLMLVLVIVSVLVVDGAEAGRADVKVHSSSITGAAAIGAEAWVVGA